jgi:hypothetical protein
MSEAAKKPMKVLVIGTQHELQRHQDTMPDREEVRADFDKFLRGTIEERTIDLVAEEAGDDAKVWETLKLNDVFGDGMTVDFPVPTIAMTIADKSGLRHEDVDVDGGRGRLRVD